MLKTGRRAAAAAPKYMNKFSFPCFIFFSLSIRLCLSLSLTHHTHSENPFLPKSLGKTAETEAKHHTQ